MNFAQAELLAPHLGCAPGDLLSHAAGISIPVACRIAAAFSESTPADYEMNPPLARVPALPGLKEPQDCFAAELLDDSADRLYPPGSVLVARPAGGAIPLGTKFLFRHFTGSGPSRRTMEILVGVLEHESTGGLTLGLRSHNRELPANLTIQRAETTAGLGESRLEPESLENPVDYAPFPNDPGEIIGVVVMAITSE